MAENANRRAGDAAAAELDRLGGAIGSKNSRSIVGTQADRVDPRLVFLARAAARDMLVMAGEMTLDEAIDGLVPAFEQLRPCACAREIYERLSRGPSGPLRR